MIDKFKTSALCKTIMDLMEKEGFTVEEAERIPIELAANMRKNSEQQKKEMPFTVINENK